MKRSFSDKEGVSISGTGHGRGRCIKMRIAFLISEHELVIIFSNKSFYVSRSLLIIICYFQDRKNTKTAVNGFGHYHYNNKTLRIGRNLWCTSDYRKNKHHYYT